MTTPDPSDETFGRIIRKFGGLIGSNYEEKVAHRSVGMARRRLRLRDAEIMAAITKARCQRAERHDVPGRGPRRDHGR